MSKNWLITIFNHFRDKPARAQGGILIEILGYSSFNEVREISFEAEVRGTSGEAKLKIKAVTSTGEKIELKAEWIITEELPGTGLVLYYNGEGTAIVKINRVETTHTLNTVRFASSDYTDLHIAGGEDWDDVFRVSWSEVTKIIEA